MVVEVYSPIKPAVPHRAVILSVLLLALVSLLAASMVWQRSGDDLGPRVGPDGWRASFRPPKRFFPGELIHGEKTAFLPFYSRGPGGTVAELVVWEIGVEGSVEPGVICTLIRTRYASQFGLAILGNRDVIAPSRLGEVEGVEHRDPRGETVVRAVVLDGAGIACAISLNVKGERISERLYELFDLTCLSVEYRNP